MKQQQFKYIKGMVQQGNPADIYFFTDVDGWSVDNFLWEFNYLVDRNVSQINIHVNSCGGSVVDGMSVFSRILDCKIPTACYNDGLAASMGSIIWAAGQEVYMKDYALLMIHNPFIDDQGSKQFNQITEAFKQQLQTIYKKRFGLSDEEIEAIMNGEEGNDGTFFTAEQAVEKGFLPADHVIETPAAVKSKVNAIVKGGYDLSKLKAVMNEVSDFTVPTVKSNVNSNNKTMTENEITVFAALLGMTGKEANVESVSAQITALKAKAEQFDTLKAALDEKEKELGTVKTELEGSKASVANLTADLDEVKSELGKYKEAEVEAQKARIDALVEDAINACKINKDDKETWVKMAENDYELAKSVLDKIPARQDISKTIAHVDEPVAQQELQSEEEKIEAKVNEVVGKEFQFRTLE